MTASPRRVRLAAGPSQDELVALAVSRLAEGELVALPTETVYGVGARADRTQALQALRRAKGRDASLPFTWHIGDPEQLLSLEVSPLVRRLVDRYWPGPLTLVLPIEHPTLGSLGREGWLGVRAPAHPFTARVLREAPFPVALSSANPSGDEPLCDPDEIERELGSHLSLLVDAGPPQLAEASCVLRVGRGRFELLRSGLFTLEELRSAAGLAIGFVCTGNTCRSPMAEALARVALAERLGTTPEHIDRFGFRLTSMGVFAGVDAPPSPNAVRALRERGVVLGEHRSRPATLEALLELDRVYGMTAAHVDALRAMLPPGKAEHVDMLDAAGGDVPDPFGGDLERYRRCADRLAELVARRACEWA